MIKALERIAILAVLVAAWSGQAAATSNMDRIREKAEEYLQKLYSERYDHEIKAEESKLDRVAKDFAYLFSETKINDIEDELRDAEDPTAQAALPLLRDFIEAQIVASRTAPIRDELSNFVLEEEKELPGKGTLPFREVLSMMLAEPDRKLRKFAHVIVTDTYTIANVYRNQVIATTQDAVQSLGYASIPELRASHQRVDYDQLKTYCEALLAETVAAYETGLAEQAGKVLDEELDKVRRYDLEFLTFSTEMDPLLKKHKPEKAWNELARSLRLVNWKKVADINLKDDAKRLPRNHIYPIDLLKEIIAAGRQRGPAAEWVFQLEAFGRIQRLLLLTTPQFEFRRLAAEPIDLACGYLFSGLLAEPAFTTAVLGLNEAEAGALRRSRQVAELIDLRLDAASFLYELILHEDFKMAQPKHNDFMEQHLKIQFNKIDSERYLDDFEFDVVGRVVGRQLAVQMRQALRQKFGATWWTSPEAGSFLREIWASGSQQTPAELSAELGFGLFDTAPVVAEMTVTHAGD